MTEIFSKDQFGDGTITKEEIANLIAIPAVEICVYQIPILRAKAGNQVIMQIWRPIVE